MKLVSNTLLCLVSAGALGALVLSSVVRAADDGPALSDSPTTRQRVAAALAGPPASDKELEEISLFMKQFVPARWAAMETLPESGANRRSVMVYIIARWRHLQILREEDAQLYEIKVRQMTAEDAIYGLLARTHSPADREPLRKNLRDKVTELVKLTLQERQHRIERLRQALKNEENRLAQDQGVLNSAVERRVDAFITDGPVTLHPDLPRGPRHSAPNAATPGTNDEPTPPPAR